MEETTMEKGTMDHPTRVDPRMAETGVADRVRMGGDAAARLGREAIEALRGQMRGRVLLPGEDEYDEARRVWNGMIDRFPAVIVQCRGAADVAGAVRFAREHALPLAVKGGGHNVAGTAVCDGGLVVDLSPMNGVRVDPERKLVRVGGGARLGDIDHETQAFGLAVPLGVVSATGIGGLSLHGGFGFLARKLGLTCDHLVSADVVTADGRILAVDARNHPELLWALKGGGGNFGIVTSFEFQLHPVGPEVWLAVVMYPMSSGLKVLRFFREFLAEAPDEITPIAVLWNSPADESIPEKARNVPVIVLAACYSGAMENGERMIRPLREVETPLLDLSGPLPFLNAQKLFDPEYPNGRRYYWKAAYLKHLEDEVIETLVRHAELRPSSISSIDVWGLGGAVSRVAPKDTAFGVRDAPVALGIEANWDDPDADEANLAWARELYRDTRRFSSDGSYLNFPGFVEEGESLIRGSYRENYPRLQKVKAQYDPDNVFRHNMNIPPGG